MGRWEDEKEFTVDQNICTYDANVYATLATLSEEGIGSKKSRAPSTNFAW